MKLKKIFALMLSILFVAALSAQTKEVPTNKLIKTLEKNKKTGKNLHFQRGGHTFCS